MVGLLVPIGTLFFFFVRIAIKFERKCKRVDAICHPCLFCVLLTPCFESRLLKIRQPNQESRKLGPPAEASFYFRGACIEPLPLRLRKELKLAAPQNSPYTW